MNLIVDIGNTSTKIALFEDGMKLSVSRIKDISCAALERILTGNKIEKAIVSSVRTISPAMHDLFFSDIAYVHILTHKSKLPFSIEYETPETLGTDRIAGVAAAYHQFTGNDCLIIDSGSALTFDFLSGNCFRGGNISPGLSMRFKALNKFTDRLPLVDRTDYFTSPGRNTKDAISAGVITGVVYEINEYIRTFESMHAEFKTILTGGDSEFLKDKIDYRIAYMPDIVIDGLNYILEYNAK
jgi:type III pantothenate kinase